MKATPKDNATPNNTVKASLDVAAVLPVNGQQNPSATIPPAGTPMVNQFNTTRVNAGTNMPASKAPKIEMLDNGTILSDGEVICIPGSHAGMMGY